jgi:hypothetical protein
MTPRALLTIIGATAIGFAIAIGGAAGLAANTSMPSATTAQVSAPTEQTVHELRRATPGTNLAHLLRTGPSDRGGSSNSDCAIAL